MRIGTLARRVGLSRDTIRFYERQGLIASAPAPEATNNYRVYDEDVVFTLELIRDAQAAGMTIADLTIFIGQLQAGDPADFDADTFLAEKIAEVETRIERSQKFLRTLKDTRAALAAAPLDAPQPSDLTSRR